MPSAPIDDSIVDVAEPRKDTIGLPEPALARLTKAGVDLSNGYPYRPSRPLYLDDVYRIRSKEWKHDDAGARADKSKSALLSAATKVTDLTTHIGTEIEGLQLKDLTDQQKDELALLIAERSVVFFRNQDISPQQQLALGRYYGEVEVHPQVAQVPGNPGVTVIWPDLQATERSVSFRQPGDRSNPDSGPKHIERVHPLVRVHPATGWKALWVNRTFTDRIVGLDRGESDAILNYLFGVYEGNVDIQLRFKWTPGTSALWDNRVTIHNASWDYGGKYPRHGTRVTSLAEKPYFDDAAPTRRQALGLLDEGELIPGRQ
ncbi:alpha-ketoglutarate-dependent taurine dioxygenase [Lentinula edodes]|uniref:Alpha-ketoglutarate-dependent taurine dioxygenase n=1 Tax=Lentinula edodes TaxID=5353 RepID=A0A1Q3DZX4_LENED|nr:alpha-ketoglutarate-dependent taurine dioxygenase [Lentinula edodes]